MGRRGRRSSLVPACVQCLCVPCLCAGAPPPLPLSGHGCVSCNLSLCLSSLPPLVYLLPLPRWTSSGYRAPPLARRARDHECAVRVHVRRGSSDGATCRCRRSGVAHVCGVRTMAPWAPRPPRRAPLQMRWRLRSPAACSLQHHRVSLSDANPSAAPTTICVGRIDTTSTPLQSRRAVVVVVLCRSHYESV